MSNNIKIISFDLEGTLVALNYSHVVWHEGIPTLYAETHGIDFSTAKNYIEQSYDEVGHNNRDWYDISYWFHRFKLGDYRPVLQAYTSQIFRYPEVHQVLAELAARYPLVISSASGREFMPYLLDGLEKYFIRIFSSISDYNQMKDRGFYSSVCRELNVPPEEVVHVGDSWQFDVVPARQVGINAFHLDRERQSGKEISLADLNELKDRL